MFEARFPQGRLLKDVADALANVVEFATFACTDDSIIIRGVDKDTTAMTCVMLSKWVVFSPVHIFQKK